MIADEFQLWSVECGVEGGIGCSRFQNSIFGQSVKVFCVSELA